MVQTNAFKSGKMTDPVMRANVASLSATDIQDISDYFSSQRAKQAKFAIGRSKALSKVSKSTFSLRESKGELKEINKMAFRGKESFYLEAF